MAITKTKQSAVRRPMARSEQLITEQVGLETVVFDLSTRSSHALKPLAAAVYMYADGKNTVAEIAELASYRLETQVTEAEVSEAVEQLAAADLLASGGNGFSRRDALKVFAATGAGAALITSVSASSAFAATEAPQTSLGNCLWCATGSTSSPSGTITPSASGYNCSTDPSSSSTSGAVVSSNGSFYPQPGVSKIQPGGSGTTYTLSNTCTGSGGACWNSDGSPNVTEGASCSYLAKSGSSYAVTAGYWQCVPCDGTDGYQCCSVVCAPSGTGYPWGSLAVGPPTLTPDYLFDHPTSPYAKPPNDTQYPYAYTGCGTNTSGCSGTGTGGSSNTCPDPGEPDYHGSGNNYWGKYCTECGGKPSS